MIRVRGLMSSIKSRYLPNRNPFPHKAEDSWDREFNQQNVKMNQLVKLLQTNSVQPYLIEKDIKELEKQDICFFYMHNKTLLQRIFKHSKHELVKNPNATTIFKFRLALELNSFSDEQIRLHLLQSFNASINTLSTKDLLFCLQIVIAFRQAKHKISNLALEKKFLKQDGLMFVKFVYLLTELEMKLQTISSQVILEKISQIDNLQLQTIYQVKTVVQFYGLNLPEPVEKRLTELFSRKRKKFTKQEELIIIDLLSFYPHSINLINISSFSIESYISYLQFFIPKHRQTQQVNPKFSIPNPIQHPIPASILASAEMIQIQKIIKIRLVLQLENIQSLLNTLKDQTTNLNCVFAIVRCLEKEQKINAQAQAIIQKSILKKFVNQGEKIFEKFKIVDLFKLLGYLSVRQLGTINFWKKTLKFVTNAIQDSQNYKNITSEEQKKFVVYLFQIFNNKPFPRQLEDQIINLALLSLTINKWNLNEILSLIISLTKNNIADNELWFGIEQRIKKIDLAKQMDFQEGRKTFKKIAYNFNSISKGSYEFWTQVNKHLNKKQKQQILNFFKIPSTLAHTYFKI